MSRGIPRRRSRERPRNIRAWPNPELIRRFNVRVPLRDGSTLSADLVLPAGPARAGDRPADAVRQVGRAAGQTRGGLRARRVRLRQRGRPRAGRLRRGVRAVPQRRAGRGRRHRVGRRPGLVHRRRRDVRGQLRRPDPVADRAAAAARAARDGVHGDAQRPLRGVPHRPAVADADRLAAADRRPGPAVHRRRGLGGGLPAPAAGDDGRGGRVRVRQLAGRVAAPHPGRLVGAGPLPAPDRRDRPAGAARVRLVRRRGDRHPGQLRRDDRRRAARASGCSWAGGGTG